jgi:arsenate reductase
MKIYHNPRCNKSRQALTIVAKNTSEFEIVEYLKNPLTVKEIKVLLPQLNIKASELVRTQEAIWKENYKGKILTDNEIINIMAKNPKLIERPIVEHNNKAVIGRPPENILSLFT